MGSHRSRGGRRQGRGAPWGGRRCCPILPAAGLDNGGEELWRPRGEGRRRGHGGLRQRRCGLAHRDSSGGSAVEGGRGYGEAWVGGADSGYSWPFQSTKIRSAVKKSLLKYTPTIRGR